MNGNLIDGPADGATAVAALSETDMQDWLAGRPAAEQAWLDKTGFTAKPGKWAWLPPGDGGDRVLFCLPERPGAVLPAGATGCCSACRSDRVLFCLPERLRLWDWAALPGARTCGALSALRRSSAT